MANKGQRITDGVSYAARGEYERGFRVGFAEGELFGMEQQTKSAYQHGKRTGQEEMRERAKAEILSTKVDVDRQAIRLIADAVGELPVCIGQKKDGGNHG